ncbi:nucleoside-diphosphate kinase [Burkholderia sp. LMG 21824]|uniref:nucleoside-diphosphate kinase n=1 Tax=Burkholderia sp. LMG 21824 TaxID=3158172 RepID=UPI003C2EFD29
MKWDWLTRIPHKATLYEREVYFRESLADAQRVLDSGVAQTLRNCAFIVVKPDGVLAGKVVPILDFLEKHAFTVIAVEHPVLGRFQWREMWRYQLTSATLDRLAANELVLQGQCLMLLVVQEIRQPLPATVRISSLKGPSQLELQWPGCLRQLIGQPNRIFSHIHVADEPADFVRELGILFEQADRLRIFQILKEQEPLSFDAAQRLKDIAATSQAAPKIFDAAGALTRVEQAAANSIELEEHAKAAITAHLELMRQGRKIDWAPFARLLQPIMHRLDRWDLGLLVSSYIVYDEFGFSKQIAGVDAAAWSTSDDR